MSIVTISRGTFIGGQALAQRVAEQLGYRCIGREEIIEAATSYGVPVGKLTAAMDKAPSLWERLTGERAAYLDFVRAVLCERAREGNLVYHGHVGHFLLRGISHVISVRVVADLEFRVRAAMDQQSVTRKDALANIKRVDRERFNWARFLYGVEWDDPSLYDLVLNLGRISLASAAEVVIRMTAMEQFRPTAQSLKAMEDLVLGSRVSAALARDERTRVTGLRVAADGGAVTIAGLADSWPLADAIPEVAAEVEGVNAVRCEVEVIPLSEAARF